ncbi:MAG: DUF998 domain-containing protein [Candidatus Hermodarchaeota archaeon]
MNSDILKWPISIIAGILVIVLYCIFTFTSIALYPPPYSAIDNWLSDLGNSSFNPNGAIFYNLGCILTGIMLFPFYLGLYKWYLEKSWHKVLMIVTQIVGCCSGFALIMIGVFSEDFMTEHIFWSEIFFKLNLGVLVLASITLMFHPKAYKIVVIYGIAVAIINLIFVYFIGTPLVEWITVFTALGYAGLIVYNTYNEMVLD